MLGARVCLTASESVFTYTFRAIATDATCRLSSCRHQINNDGRWRHAMRKCEGARMRAKVMTWNACAAIRVESGTLESLVWDQTHVTFQTEDPHLEIHTCGGAGLSWCCGKRKRPMGLTFISLDP
jgi:hypothetical protein